MSGLPKGWVEATIGEIASYIQRGKSPIYAAQSELPVVNQKAVRWTGIQEEHLKFVDPKQWSAWGDERFLRAGDVLWNSTGTGTIGRAAVYFGLASADRAVADSHVTIVRLGDAADSKYVHQFIRSDAIQTKISDMQAGSTNQVELNRAEIVTTAIPLPPLPEQRRIVAKIDALSARSARASAELDRIAKLVERCKQAILARLLRLDPATDATPWTTVRLGDIADIGTGSTPKRSDARYYKNGSIPWITSGAVNDSLITQAQEFVTPHAIRETNCKVFPVGTLLIAMYGEGKTRGKVAALGIAAATNQALVDWPGRKSPLGDSH